LSRGADGILNISDLVINDAGADAMAAVRVQRAGDEGGVSVGEDAAQQFLAGDDEGVVELFGLGGVQGDGREQEREQESHGAPIMPILLPASTGAFALALSAA
jgi:hypothetical protein